MYSVKLDSTYYGKSETPEKLSLLLTEMGWPYSGCFCEHVRVINGRRKYAAIVYFPPDFAFTYLPLYQLPLE